MIRENQKAFNALQILIDAVCIVFSFTLAYYIRFYSADFSKIEANYLKFASYIPILVIMVPLYLVIYYFLKLYNTKRSESLIDEIASILTANSLGISIIVGILFITKATNYSRLVLAFYLLLNCVLTTLVRVCIRLFLRNLRRRGYNVKSVLLLGTGSISRSFLKKIKNNPQFGYQIYGCLSDTMGAGKQFLNNKILGTLDTLEEIISARVVDQVVVAIELEEYHKMEKIIAVCEKQGVKIDVIPAYYTYMPSNPYLDDLDGIPILTLRKIPLSNVFSAFIKRIFDLVVATFCLILFSPVMIATAMSIKMTSKGEVIFKQERIGLNCKPFVMYKFRSMEIIRQEDVNGWTMKNDTRRTKFGTFIRKYSIDELPQFFNVLKGEMSVVGPRPEIECFVKTFMDTVPRYMVKHQIKPGITGLAQIRGLRGDTSIEERIKTDIQYIENWNLFLDIKILLRTVTRAFYNENE